MIQRNLPKLNLRKVKVDEFGKSFCMCICHWFSWIYPMYRKTPCFSYEDIRHFHRIYASN